MLSTEHQTAHWICAHLIPDPQTSLLGKYHHPILQEGTNVQKECGENGLKVNLGQILENLEH